jgi:hypothetical protein
MKRTKHPPTPESITSLEKQLSEFRATHPVRTRLPDWLWQAAAALARQHGVYAVAHPLRLDYVGLKRRMGRTAPTVRMPKSERAKPTSFVEWVAPVLAGSRVDTCVIEFESARGGKMRIHWPAQMPPDWPSLLRTWRELEG